MSLASKAFEIICSLAVGLVVVGTLSVIGYGVVEIIQHWMAS